MWELLMMLMLTFNEGDVQVDYASVFAQVSKDGKRDKWAGGPSPCINRLVRPTDNLIAHRSLPCGTKVRLTNFRTGKTTITYVGERGPYGACTYPGWKKWKEGQPLNAAPCPKGYWRIKKKKSGRGIWRGSIDITPRVRKALGHNGFELVQLDVLPARPRKPRRLQKLVANLHGETTLTNQR